MYRILMYQPNMAKDTWKFYKQTVTTIDPDSGEAIKTTTMYEAETLADLAETYKKLLETQNAANLIPVDMLKVNMDIAIVDETAE